MLSALVLGGASCVWDDAAAALDLFSPDIVVAVNDIGTRWAGGLDYWCSLHPDKMQAWRKGRMERGLKPAGCHIGHEMHLGIDKVTDYRWPGMNASGSSGLFAVKVALDHGADRVVLAGVPMQPERAHFFNGSAWSDCGSFLDGWRNAMPFIKDGVRSMSGWTKEILGEPSPGWLAESQI